MSSRKPSTLVKPKPFTLSPSRAVAEREAKEWAAYYKDKEKNKRPDKRSGKHGESLRETKSKKEEEEVDDTSKTSGTGTNGSVDEAGEVKCDWVTRMRHILRHKKDTCAGLLKWWEKLGNARLGDKDASTESTFVNKILQMMKTNYWRIVEGDELTKVTGFTSLYKLQNYFTTYLSQGTLDPAIMNWMRSFEPRAGDNKSLDYCFIELFTGEKALSDTNSKRDEHKSPPKLSRSKSASRSPSPPPRSLHHPGAYSAPQHSLPYGNQLGKQYPPSYYSLPEQHPMQHPMLPCYPHQPPVEIAKGDKEEHKKKDDKGSKKKKDSKKKQKSDKSKKGKSKSKKGKSSDRSDDSDSGSRKHKSKSGRHK